MPPKSLCAFVKKPIFTVDRAGLIKSLSACLFIFLFILTCLPSQKASAQTSTSLSIEPPLSQLTCTCATLFHVMVNNVNDLYGIDVRLEFDPSMLQVIDMDPNSDGVQIRQGSFLESGYTIINKVDNMLGTIRFVATQLNPALPKSGTGILLEIIFSATREGRSSINYKDFTLATNKGVDLVASNESGVVEASSIMPGSSCPTATPTITPTPTITSTFTPSPTRTITNTPSPNTYISATPGVYIYESATSYSLPALTLLYIRTFTPTPSAQKVNYIFVAKTALPSEATPTPIQAVRTESCSQAGAFNTLISGLGIFIYICPSALLFAIILLIVFIFKKDDSGLEDEPQDEIDFQI